MGFRASVSAVGYEIHQMVIPFVDSGRTKRQIIFKQGGQKVDPEESKGVFTSEVNIERRDKQTMVHGALSGRTQLLERAP